jgi:KUP system potassium uptake protein
MATLESLRFYTLQPVIQTVGAPLAPDAHWGNLSLIFWTHIITISVKYGVSVMRANNHGEGGILALMSPVSVSEQNHVFAAKGLFSAA